MQVFKLFAAIGTKPCQRRHLLVCLVHFPGFNVEFTEIFAGGLVIGLELQGLGIIGQRCLEITGLAQCVAEKVVDVGLWTVFGQPSQLLQSAGIIFCCDLCARRCQIRSTRRLHVVHGVGRGDYSAWHKGCGSDKAYKADECILDHDPVSSVFLSLNGGREAIGIAVLDEGARAGEWKM